jgi:putative thymidine phosphorylase
MKFKVKDIDIATGGTLVAILSRKDAAMLDLHTGDRISISRGAKKTIAILDISGPHLAVKSGFVGLMKEVLGKVDARNGSVVDIGLEKKPSSIYLIRKKLSGERLSEEDINTIIQEIVDNKLTSVETAYFVAGCYTQGLNVKETVALTRAMIKTGKVMRIDHEPVVDKHCIGGVAANRTTMVVVPILIAAGYFVPKTSSRSITSPAGTADTMEVLCNVELNIDKIKSVVRKVGGCIAWGGSVNLAPADDKILAVEQPLSLDAEGQFISSILAKKGSVAATHILIDIPVGRGAKVENISKAKRLRKKFIKVGRQLGMKIKAVITDGSQPVGNGIGPALEARDVLWVLKNDPRAPADLREKSLFLASEIMSLKIFAGKTKHDLAFARQLLESGKAWEVMKKIIKAQGRRILNPESIRVGKEIFVLRASKSGTISHIDNRTVSKIARAAGAPFDKEAGIYLHHHVGDKVAERDPLFTIYADSKQKLSFAKEVARADCGVEIN